LTTAQLRLVRDISSPPPAQSVLTAFQTSALLFADESTKNIRVTADTTERLQHELATWVDSGGTPPDKSKYDHVQDLLVEAAAVVATYNMVSRFLVSLDVAGYSDELVPWPADRQEASNFPFPG
jgi:hypothetical protein